MYAPGCSNNSCRKQNRLGRLGERDLPGGRERLAGSGFQTKQVGGSQQPVQRWREKINTRVVLIKLGCSSVFLSRNLVPPLNCVINLLLFRINVLECSAANSYNIVNIFKSFLSLSKIDFGVLNGGQTER